MSDTSSCRHIWLYRTYAPRPSIGREVKLIRLPSDSMADKGHIKLIIYNIYYAIYTDN